MITELRAILSSLNADYARRIKEGLVSGNIYELLNQVLAIENRVHWTSHGVFPASRLDRVGVNVRS